MQHHADYSSSSSSSSSSNGDLLSNTVNVKIQSDQMSETYKSLGDVLGINAAVASIAASTGNVRKTSTLSSHPPQQQQQHLKSARSVSNVLSHHEPTYQVHRLSTYANVPPANTRFGNSDSRASYNERLSVSRQPSQQQQHQPQTQRQYSSSSSNNNNPFPTISNGTPRRSGLMGPPPPPTSRSIVYKSNTSLDLDHDVGLVSEIILPSQQQHQQQQDYQHLRREYGSQGSINISGNRFTTALPINTATHGYGSRIYSGPIVEIGQSSPGPAAVSTLQRKTHGNGGMSNFVPAREINKSEDSTLGSVISNGSSTRGDILNGCETGSEHSPKLSKKKGSGGSSGFFSKERESNKSQKSLFKKFRGSKESNPDPALMFKDGVSGEASIDRQVSYYTNLIYGNCFKKARTKRDNCIVEISGLCENILML